MSDAVRFDQVGFQYMERGGFALREVDLVVPEGSFALVCGATGAGKSTFLRAINGLVPHFTGGVFSGRVVVEGRNTMECAPRDLSDVVAFVPQDPGASFVLDRVEDELAYAMENLAVEPSRMRRRVEETLDLLDIERLRDRSVRTLSGGERQRVAIASALTPGAKVLLLDEPTSQLDPQAAEDVLAALQRLVHDLGMTVLLAEHRLDRVAGFVDVAIGCLGGGRVIIGDPSHVLDRVEAGPAVSRLGRLLGWSPVPLTVRQARRMVKERGTRPGRAPSPAAAGTRPVLLQARRLSAGYDSTRVLRGVELSVRSGEVVALMGRNGAGKTTLLRCLAGLQPPDAGAVTIEGEPAQPGRNVVLCPQTPEDILFKDSVEDEVGTTSTAHGQDDRIVHEILGSLGIVHLASRHPRDLSAGERLLAAVAATVASDAKVLLLDEPTRGLDEHTKERLAAFLRSYAAGGRGVLFASHDVELVAQLARRVVMLAGGEVIADGTPREVMGESPVFAPQTARVFGSEWLTPEDLMGSLK